MPPQPAGGMPLDPLLAPLDPLDPLEPLLAPLEPLDPPELLVLEAPELLLVP